MRNLFIMTVLAIILSACSSKEDVYEKTIADYVQTDKHGTWTDLKFKAISVETTECTVNDSIQILIEDAKSAIAEKIEFEKGRLEYYQKEAENSKSFKGTTGKMMHDSFLKGVGILQHKIDSLQKIDPTQVTRYEDIEPDRLLAIYVTCKYGIMNPWNNAYQEQTEIFVLTPDGKKVTDKHNWKDNASSD